MEARGIRRRYAGGGGVGPLDFTVRAGTVTGLVGANGAGKTTLLRLITGLLEKDGGELFVWGKAVQVGKPDPDIGAMIEEPAFYRWATGEQNLKLAAAGRRERESRIAAVLDEVGLAEAANQRVATYSQGMRQRLGLARALLGDPKLLVLDEPTNGLDPHGVRWFRRFVRARADEGAAVVVSSHLLAEMRLMADHVIVIVAGNCVATLDTAQLEDRPGALEEAYFQLLEME
ncbi:MAG: ATP-binding cassette domain-containing protein [Acidothermus sp.]|nr:ATP-binding cassette domain-containing protein [Acidothermus sp.]MCL6538030.1 ATP-binding cassette domain-containing protein [Acidothermus sp.]